MGGDDLPSVFLDDYYPDIEIDFVQINFFTRLGWGARNLRPNERCDSFTWRLPQRSQLAFRNCNYNFHGLSSVASALR